MFCVYHQFSFLALAGSAICFDDGQYRPDVLYSRGLDDGSYKPDNLGSYNGVNGAGGSQSRFGFNSGSGKKSALAGNFGSNSGTAGFGADNSINGASGANAFSSTFNGIGAQNDGAVVRASGFGQQNNFGAQNNFGNSFRSGAQSNNDIRTLKESKEQDENGYKYAYETENNIEAQEQGRLDNTGSDAEVLRAFGFYQYTGDDGQTYRVDYTADENGFRPRVSNFLFLWKFVSLFRFSFFFPQGAHLPQAASISN